MALEIGRRRAQQPSSLPRSVSSPSAASGPSVTSSSDRIFRLELIRRPDCGFGFSVLGGAETALPPVVYDIVPDSPAGQCGQVSSVELLP